MNQQKIKFAFLGSSKFSEYVLDELEKAGYSPALKITDARALLPEIREEFDYFIVASFGKILPKEFLNLPKHGSLNVHPSLLPKLRGPSPIQNLILGKGEPGVTIIKMDEKMDHGPILAQEKVTLDPWPDHYGVVEEKLGRAGGKLLAETIQCQAASLTEQDDGEATFVKMIKKEDGLLDLNDDPEINYRKVLAYSTWPGAYFFFKTKMGKNLRIVVKDARIEDEKFIPTRIIPEGKKEMDWESFLRGNA